MNRRFAARHAMGRIVRGTALVAYDGFSARYDLDRIAGTFSRPTHKLAGQSYIDKILILDTAKGGVAPRALVFNSVNPILVQGAALADLPMLAGFDEEITKAIPFAAEVEVNPELGILEIISER